MNSDSLRELVDRTTTDTESLGLQYDDPDDRDVAIIVAGAGTDAGLERVVGFLAQYDVPIRVVSFDVFALASGQQLLVREVVDEEEARPRAVSVPGSRTAEEIAQLGLTEETRVAFSRIVAAAEARGLFVRPYKRGVMIAPGQLRNRYLMFLRPEPNRGLTISYGAEAFAEFFPDLTASEVEESLGVNRGRFDGAELTERAELLERFLSELPDAVEEDNPRTANAETVLALAAHVRPGEWTSYGELSVAAIGRSSAAQTIGNIARNSADFPTPHRVLNVRGAIPRGWRSAAGAGPDECRRRLESEGVRFREDGSADPAQKVTGEVIRSRVQS